MELFELFELAFSNILGWLDWEILPRGKREID